jgi:hypothetical protein
MIKKLTFTIKADMHLSKLENDFSKKRILKDVQKPLALCNRIYDIHL